MKKTVLTLLICLVGLTFAAQRFNNATSSSGTTMPDIGQSALFADIFPPFGQGYHDLVAVSDWGSDIYLFSNDGDGTFTRETSSGVTSSAYGYYTGDYNNDGLLDIFCASGTVKLYENNGDGTLTNVAGAAGLTGGTRKTLLLDYDNDGWLDVFYIGSSCRLFHNNGNETFTETTTAMGLSGATADFSGVAFDYDNDGYLDLYLLHEPVSQLWHNDGGTGFTNTTSAMGCGNNGLEPEGVDVGDYNNDGYLDIYIANISEQPWFDDDNRLYRNDAGTGFTDVTFAAGVEDIGDGRATWFVDYNNDGLTDLFCTNHVSNNGMYRNNGDGTFTNVASALGITNPWDSFGVSWCDYDTDGDLDIYMAGHFANRLMRNDDCPGNYLVLQLEGTTSNFAAIGAKVRVSTASLDRYDMIIGGSGLNGQDSLPLEFGLGTETIADIHVWWPSGLEEDYSDIATNQHLTIVEGDGIHVGTETAELAASSTEEGLLLSWQAEGIEPLAWRISRDGVTLVELSAPSTGNWLDINPQIGVNYEYALTVLLSSGEERRLDSVFARWEAPSTSEMTLFAPWPCPAIERVEVSFLLPSSTPARLSLYDLAGRRLTSLSLTPETTSATLELTDYPSGVYLLRLSSDLGSMEQRLVISR